MLRFLADSLFAHDHQVFDPHSRETGDVDARFDRHDFIRGEHVLGPGAEPRAFVDLEAHPVPEPVAEVLAVAGVLDHVAGGRVDVGRRRHPAGRPRGRLRSPPG